MEVLKDCDYLCTVELRLSHVKIANSSVIREEITSTKKLSHKVNVTIILEESDIVEDKWMLQLFKNLLLILNMIHVLAFDDFRFFHGFDSVFGRAVIPHPAYSNIAKGPLS